VPQPIVIQNESPLSGFLGGFGQALQWKGQQMFEEMDQARKLGQQIITKAATGELDPRFLATEEAQAMIKKYRLDKDPKIRNLIEEGKRQLGPMAAPQFPTQEINIPGIPNPTPGAMGLPGAPTTIQKALAGPPVMPKVTSRDVRNVVAGEDTARTLATKNAEALIDVKKSLLTEQGKKAIEASYFLNEKDAANAVNFIQSAFPHMEWTLTKDNQGWKVVSKTPDASQSTSQYNQYRIASDNLLNNRNRASDVRRNGIQAAQAIIRGEKLDAKAFEATGVDAKTAQMLANVLTAADSQKDPKLSWANAANLLIQSVNQSLKTYNDSTKRYAADAVLAGHTQYRDPTNVEALIEPDVKFEEVGGRSYDAWIKGAAAEHPPTAEEASALADKAKESVKKTPAEKINSAYTDIVETFKEAAKLKALTQEDKIGALDGMKDKIMAQYGLNPGDYDKLKDLIKATK
jgi:hypothetical protein